MSVCQKLLQILFLVSFLLLHLTSLFYLASAKEIKKVKIGVFIPRQELGVEQISLERVKPVIDIAFNTTKKMSLWNGLEPEALFQDSNCSMIYSPVRALNFLGTVHVLLGPICTFVIAAVARYNIVETRRPILTSTGFPVHLDDKNEYYNLIRIGANHRQIENMLSTIFQHYNWKPRVGIKNVAFVSQHHDQTASFSSEDDLKNSQTRIFSKHLHTTFTTVLNYYAYKIDYGMNNDKFFSELVKVLRQVRIVVLCADPDTVRDIMIKAYKLGFINGEYVFFNVDLFSSQNYTQRPWERLNDTVENNQAAREAYRVLLTITLRKPSSQAYKNFSAQVKQRAKEKYNFDYPEEEVNSFVGAFHDAVLLYALALNDTIAEKGIDGIGQGSVITQNMKNRTFEGITGTVSINANGDRNADYSLLDMDPKTGNFEVRAHYLGSKREYETVGTESIDWMNKENKPPPDIPKCGFDNSGCKTDNPQLALYVIVVLAILICVLSILIVIVYRKLRLENELHAMSWRIRWDELETQERIAARRRSMASQNSKLRNNSTKISFGNNHAEAGSLEEKEPFTLVKYSGAENSSRENSIASVETVAGVSLSQIQTTQLYTKTAIYRGTVVALKPLTTKNKKFDINNSVLMEIKRVKDLTCDHIVRFVGACLDPPNDCIVTEYCPKGSLQDILENDTLNLDWMFKFSLIQDICRGMIYLHQNYGSHGNLKSSNCLVDSRFSLKITDFGLYSFRGNKETKDSEDGDYSIYRHKLWTAPELLRLSSPPVEGTKEGDVYSFGIISQEIIYRKGVFYFSDYEFPEPQDIIAKVKEHSNPPFRPTLNEELQDLPSEKASAMLRMIRASWQEDHTQRPDFKAIKSMMRGLNKDADSGNILDNLLSRMEQYSNNLESLVTKRTDQYLEEKKKAEDLLYHMLPKSVATTLMKGEAVSAEWFDDVSIYFSDICGFTALSSESSPMQVVDLLNDLYTIFDQIIEKYDAYKVETIGDAYMVTSGLPQRNGKLHAREIARMALHFLRRIFTFKIRHIPNCQLKLRIGIHSGPVCAGVVGLKMPRYCLFGDTVNTASRMESNGAPLRIHISSTTYTILQEIGNFVTSVRGEIEMKGKGKQLTYWLHGEGTDIVDPIDSDSSPVQVTPS